MGDTVPVLAAATVIAAARPDAMAEVRFPTAVNLRSILGPLNRGSSDPTLRLAADGCWRASLGPAGPVTVHYQAALHPPSGQPAGSVVVVRAWGPGAEQEVAAAGQVLGAQDDASGFAWQAHPLMARAHRSHGQRWRPPRTGRTWEALAPAILEQKVTGVQARRSWGQLVRRFGTPAPGPGAGLGLWATPPAATWAAIPSWEYHRAGVDPARMRTLMQAARRGPALERLATIPPAEAREVLATLPGIGIWTAAEVAIRAWGDLDAVSFGDFHLARLVGYSLTGSLDSTDADMATLLEPWAGQRARAVRMIELVGQAPPRRGPRATITDHRAR